MKVFEHHYSTAQHSSFLRHSNLLPHRKTLLFLHGIGDSGLGYLPFLESHGLSNFNIIIPDWLGYGQSLGGSDYRFITQIKLLLLHLHAFNVKDIVLIPHSMAGIHAMLLCESSLKEKIIGVINIMGSITQYGSFIAFNATQNQDHFDSWFEDFKERMVRQDLVQKYPICQSHYTSLCRCDPNAFLANALEIYQVSTSERGQYTNRAGKAFARLLLPKIYAYGDQSLCQESVDFLHQYHIPTRLFHSANHFVMLDCLPQFIDFIASWSSHLITQNDG